MKGTDFALDSEEDLEELDRRIIKTARELNKQRNARSKSKAKKVRKA